MSPIPKSEGVFRTLTGSVIYWLGLTKAVCPGGDWQCQRRGWQWVDGTNYSWHDWYTNYQEPDPDELCAEIGSSGTWYGNLCNISTSRFICEKGMFEYNNMIATMKK